jgi:peptide deformylase
MRYPIVTFGDDRLRQKAVPVGAITPDIVRLLDDMQETLHIENGLGLAAEQVGKPLAVCVVDIPPDMDVNDEQQRENPDLPMPLELINPEITWSSRAKVARDEGCLSFPKIYASVTRPAEVRVTFRDRLGASRELLVRGLAARAVQHELDHLNGVLLVDRMSAVKRIALKSRLRPRAPLSRRTPGPP